MLTDLTALLAATALFVGGHFALSSEGLRAGLIERLGARGFQVLYSSVVGVGLVWTIVAYRAAPYVELWPAAPALRWVPVLVMPLALFMVIAGGTTPSPTRVGAAVGAAGMPTGILTVTRHPGLWGFALWAASHIVANGDLASLILMGGVLALALGGMTHIDRRREREFGSAWGPIALATGILPFAAILAGRTRLDWRGIGWWRPVLALAVYAALLATHGLIFGVGALPG